MQTTEMEYHALGASAYKRERLVAKGYSLSRRDVDWIKGLAEGLGVSESQALRGVLRAAHEDRVEPNKEVAQ